MYTYTCVTYTMLTYTMLTSTMCQKHVLNMQGINTVVLECDIPTPCGNWRGVDADPAKQAYAVSIVRAGDSMLQVGLNYSTCS